MTYLDEKTHNLFKFYGAKCKEYRQKCIGLLPAVYKSKIYRQKGFASIFEYAAKLAGMSNELVKRVLSLDERFEETPALQQLLIAGKVSVHKLARVASVATAENQEFWATQVQLLPSRALETLIHDEKYACQTLLEAGDYSTISLQEQQENNINNINKNGLQKTLFEQNFVHVHKNETENKQENAQVPSPTMALINETMKLNLQTDTLQKLLELQNKGIDINQLILEFLEKREMEIAQEKEEIAAEIYEKELIDRTKQKSIAPSDVTTKTKKRSRYIKAKIQKILKKEFGEKCSINGCNKPSLQQHHTQRYGISQNNDPRYLAPLCKEHHQIAHTIDLQKVFIQQKLGYG